MNPVIKMERIRPSDGLDPLDLFLNGFRSPQTKSAYRHDLKLFFGFLATIGVAPPEVKPLHITEYLTSFQGTVAPKTFNRRLSSIKSFYKWALNNEFMKLNPAAGIKYENPEPLNPTTALTDQEATRLMNAPDTSKVLGASDRLALVLMFHLGLRRTELVTIRWADIKKERGVCILTVKGKGRKLRDIPLTEKVITELKAFKTFYHIKTGYMLQNDHMVIQRFRKPAKRPTSPSTILKMMKKYAKMLDISKAVGTHSCRATVLSQLLEMGESIRNVQTFAGHSSPYVTMMYDKKRDGLKNSSAFKVNFDNDETNNTNKKTS